MATIILDCETLPSQRDWARDELAASIRPPGTIKKAETLAAWERDDKPVAVEDAWLKTSFDGALGQLCVIGWAVDDGEPQSLQVDDLSRESERKVLAGFFDAVRGVHYGNSGQRPLIVGHNLPFDLGMLWKRAFVLGVKPPLWLPRDPKPWSESVFDTMSYFAGVKDRISLDRLCRVLGIEGKTGMTGADVWPAVRDGRISEVAAYCRHDVLITRAVYRRLTFAESQ